MIFDRRRGLRRRIRGGRHRRPHQTWVDSSRPGGSDRS